MALHIAEKSPTLMPDDSEGRARARTWVFAAINSIEPHIQNLITIDLFNSDKAWAIERRPEALAIVKDRLDKLNVWMKGKQYLEGDRFTVGDLMMTTVLRSLRTTDILTEDFSQLEAYRLRCEARPAFKRALDGQMNAFKENAPSAK